MTCLPLNRGLAERSAALHHAVWGVICGQGTDPGLQGLDAAGSLWHAPAVDASCPVTDTAGSADMTDAADAAGNADATCAADVTGIAGAAAGAAASSAWPTTLAARPA